MGEPDPEPEDTTADLEYIRAEISEEEVRKLAWELYGFKCVKVSVLKSGLDDVNIRLKVSENHENPFVSFVNTSGYTMKIMNTVDSFGSHVLAQCACARYLHTCGFPAPITIPMVNGKDMDLIDIPIPELIPVQTRRHMVRLQTFIPGIAILQDSEIEFDKSFLYRLGRAVSYLRALLRGFYHPILETYKSRWSMINLPKLRPLFSNIRDPEVVAGFERIIKEFEENLLPVVDQCSFGVIHGDAHYGNFIFKKLDVTPETYNPVLNNSEGRDDKYTATGVIDFGDMAKDYYVFEVATTCYHVLHKAEDQGSFIHVVDRIGYFLAGYFVQEHLSDLELRVLKYAIAARVVNVMCIVYLNMDDRYTTAKSQAEQLGPVLRSVLGGLPLVLKLLDYENDLLLARWKSLIETDGAKSFVPRTDKGIV